MFWIFSQYRLIQGQRDLNTGFSNGRMATGTTPAPCMIKQAGGFVLGATIGSGLWLWQRGNRKPCLEGAAASLLRPLLRNENTSSVLPNLLFFYFFKRKQKFRVLSKVPWCLELDGQWTKFFKMLVKHNAIPWAADLGSLVGLIFVLQLAAEPQKG